MTSRLLVPLVSAVWATLLATAGQAELLVEYTFENAFQDSSGNNRHGMPVAFLGFGEPTAAGGVANFSGDPLAWLEVPLGAANPFDGSQDFTIEMTFNTLGSGNGGGGVILMGSADSAAPTEPDNHAMSIFIEPQEAENGDEFGGSLVYDNYFVGEVRVPDALLLDGQDHSLKITYSAAAADPAEPGTLFINLDDVWVARGEIAPDIPIIADHTVTIGSSLNEDFPFDCAEGDCLTQEFVGTVDNVRIFNEAMLPTELRAVVDRGTGEIRLLGGEFLQEIRFYEMRSEAGSLDPTGWNSLSDQGADSLGGDPGQSWDELAGLAEQLAEGFLLGSSVFGDGRSASLGNSYNTSVDAQDLLFEVVNVSLDRVLVPIEYVGAPPAGTAGDYNGSGLVEQADLDLVLLNWGSDAAGAPQSWVNDLPGGTIDQDELDGVLLNWGNAAAGLSPANVPEPAALGVGAVLALFTLPLVAQQAATTRKMKLRPS